MKLGKELKHLFQSETVLMLSLLLALLSMFLVAPSKDYLSYIDFRTLAILFCLMTIMAGLQKLLVFRQIGEGLIRLVHTRRSVAFVLILLCFFFSMFITNDVALLTFVPFTIVVLSMTGSRTGMIEIIVLETAAANLGSMMLPMGNPQNLYLYSLANASLFHFVMLMLPYGLLSLVLILLLCIFMVKKEEIAPKEAEDYRRSKGMKIKLAGYLLLFGLSLLVVARILDYRIGFLLVLIAILIMDPKIFPRVDYTLLFTFTFLFIFIGNLKQIPAVSSMLGSIVGGHEVLTSILASQVISNVPAAILLSGFTENIEGLIVGTNLGGLGTLIASMASLISFKQYGLVEGADKGKYIRIFTLVNLGLLACLLVENMLLC